MFFRIDFPPVMIENKDLTYQFVFLQQRYDFDEYSKNRGMYLDVSKELPCHMVVNENELYEEIKNTLCQYDEACKKTAAFQKKYVSEFGRGARLTCDYLVEIL